MFERNWFANARLQANVNLKKQTKKPPKNKQKKTKQQQQQQQNPKNTHTKSEEGFSLLGSCIKAKII